MTNFAANVVQITKTAAFQAREGGHRAGAFQDQTGSLFWFAGQMRPTQELQQKAAGLSSLFLSSCEKKDQGRQLLFAEKTVLGARNEDNKEGTFFCRRYCFGFSGCQRRQKEDILLQKTYMQFYIVLFLQQQNM